MLKETLEQSLLELSKSNTVHFKETVDEISSTRLALLHLEGVDIEKLCNIEARFKTWSKLDKEVKQLQEQKERLQVSIMKLEAEIQTKSLKRQSKGKVTKSVLT